MSRNLIFTIIGSVVLGLVIGGLITYKLTNDKAEKANLELSKQEKVIDSLNLREELNKEHTEQLLKLFDKNIVNFRNNIKSRDEEFKKDTTVYSSDELLDIIRSRVNYN